MKKIFVRKEKTIPFTKDGYQKILDEKRSLLAARPDAVEHLRKAREMGDLSENGYYHASKARLSGLDARLRVVDRLVKLGRIVESHGTGRVEIGSTVTISDGQNEYTYTIVGGYESNPAEHTISYISPIGKALMGLAIQEVAVVTSPRGIAKYTVITIQ